MKILVVGDLHFREIYPHAEKFEDRRLDERQKIEDEIVKASKGCGAVVLCGDVFDSRNNTSKTVKNVTSFIERFGKTKQVFIVAGNHESSADGTSALDYLSEIKDKNWLVINNGITRAGDLCFVPYYRQTQFGVDTNEEVVEKVLEGIDGFKEHQPFAAIFIHHAIAGSSTVSGQLTDHFHEPVFSADELLKRSRYVFGAHIHNPQDYKNKPVSIVGSVMNHDIGEANDKRVIVYDTETGEKKDIALSGRKFVKMVNPTDEDIAAVKDLYGLIRIVSENKVTIPDGTAESVDVFEIPKESRKKGGRDVDDFSPENLLRIYAEARGVDLKRLMSAWSHIGG